VDQVWDGLEHGSGLLGLGGTADMRELLARAGADSGADSDDARLAIDVYLHRLRAGISAMAAAMDGLDGLVFTGGVGENAASIRAGAVRGLRFLGLELDDEANEHGAGDREIGRRGVPPATLVVTSREELEIARQARSVLGR
jgi:acetate kinase